MWSGRVERKDDAVWANRCMMMEIEVFIDRGVPEEDLIRLSRTIYVEF